MITGRHALVAIGEDELVQRHPRRARRRRSDGRILVEDRVGSLPSGARADNARSRSMDERLAAAGERIEQRNDRALVIGARGIDDDVGGLRRSRESIPRRPACPSPARCRRRERRQPCRSSEPGRSPDARRPRDGRRPIRRYSPMRPCRRFSFAACHHAYYKRKRCARERMRRSNPCHAPSKMDCFASLAMTTKTGSSLTPDAS